MLHSYRVAVANVPPGEIARTLRAAGFNGTVTPGAIGFTAEWGEERTTVLEVATARRESFLATVAQLLHRFAEQCAYLTVDGAFPSLIFHTGALSPLPADIAAEEAAK